MHSGILSERSWSYSIWETEGFPDPSSKAPPASWRVWRGANESKSRDPRFWHRWANAGAINYAKLNMEVCGGDQINSTIGQAIKMAQAADQEFKNIASVQLASLLSGEPIPMFLVSFEFNGVKVGVCQNFNPELICRDWLRALSGYISGKVGPYPKAELSTNELAKDERIRKEKEARHTKEAAAYQAIQDKKEREFLTELIACPVMDRDETKWQEGITAQKGDGYYPLLP